MLRHFRLPFRVASSLSRLLRNAVLALILFLMVANCAPSRPREDAGRVPGNPASYLPSVVRSSSGSSSMRSGHRRKAGPTSSAKGDATASDRAEPAAFILQEHPPNAIDALQRIYRWSTACSSLRSGGDLLRLLPNGTVDARGRPADPDTDIELSSVGPDGKIYIISKTRKLYLCFNKKGKLVTREKPAGDKTLCQFYETSRRGNRRFVSVYRRHRQRKRPGKISRHQVPWPVPLPGLRDASRKGSSRLSPPGHGVGLADGQQHADDWQVGFGRSGEPLRGSAWRNSKHANCFDLVEHVDHVRPSAFDQVSPVGSNQMSLIFQSENSVPERLLAAGVDPSTKPTSPARKNKAGHRQKSPAKGRNAGRAHRASVSGKRKLRRKAIDRKRVATSTNSWTSGLLNGGASQRNRATGRSSGSRAKQKSRSAGVGEERGRAARAKSETTRVKAVAATAEAQEFAPVEFWKNKLVLKEADHNDAIVTPGAPAAATNVDFDSYLAETERLLAHPAEVVANAEEAAASSSAGQRSAFIQRDSGGWEEVIINQSNASPVAGQAPHLPRHDLRTTRSILVVSDERVDPWQTQVK